MRNRKKGRSRKAHIVWNNYGILRYFGFKGMDDLPELEETENEPLQEE